MVRRSLPKLSREPLALPPETWWARASVTGGYGYLLADNASLENWQTWWASLQGSDVVEYHDPGSRIFRAAAFVDDRIESCLFIGPSEAAIEWSAVKQMFAADELGDHQRRMLLSGKSADGQANSGPIVCACFGVGRATICDAIANGARSAAAIGARLKAGTNCGSCIPEMKRLIAQAGAGRADEEKRDLAVAN